MSIPSSFQRMILQRTWVELAITRCAGMLHAEGGPCPIIAVYRSDVRFGALLPVNGGEAEIDGDNHVELVDQLLAIEGEIAEGGICHVFLDESPLLGFMKADDEAGQVQARKEYATRIQEYLEANGFHSVTVVFDGIG